MKLVVSGSLGTCWRYFKQGMGSTICGATMKTLDLLRYMAFLLFVLIIVKWISLVMKLMFLYRRWVIGNIYRWENEVKWPSKLEGKKGGGWRGAAIQTLKVMGWLCRRSESGSSVCSFGSSQWAGFTGDPYGEKKEQRWQLPSQTFPAIFILKSKNSRPKGKLR